MNTSFGKKTLIFGIILLFIGVAIEPNSALKAFRATDGLDLVEVTTQISGFNGDTNYRIQVTQQQAHEIQAIFDDLKKHLSTADSLKETYRIFNDTIDSLGRCNLLPTDMDIQQLKRAVTSASRYQKMAKLLQRYTTFQGTSEEGEIQDYFCSIAGNTSTTHAAKLAKRIALRLYNIMDYHSENALLVKVATALWIVCNQLSKITQTILEKNGSHCGVGMYFGNYHYYPYPYWLHPAQGWISTNGIRGKQNITGSFWGQTMIGGWQPQDDWYMNYTWRGCLGFTGLITYIGADNAYFLGSALQVHVGPNRPEGL